MNPSGNRDAKIELIGKVFQAQYGLVVGVARCYAPMPDMVYDIVQQVFIDFMAGAENENWDIENDAKPLLYRITKNRALMFWRHVKKESGTRQAIGDILTTVTREYQEGLVNEADFLEHEMTALQDCMNKLSETNRRLIVQHYFDRIPIVQIAEAENKQANGLRKLFHRIRVKLRECIEAKLELE